MRPELADLRSDYETAGLEPSQLLAEPVDQWWRWYDEARTAGLYEPNSMVLATVDDDGLPDARIVLLRGADRAGFQFFTNYTSAKARQVARHPACALTFGWLELQRQVRVRGRIAQLDAAASDAYWASRPRESQVASAASPQSTVIANRAALEDLVEQRRREWADADEVSRPSHWGGYLVVPATIEFWQGRPARLHDRLRYRQDGDGGWIIERLAP